MKPMLFVIALFWLVPLAAALLVGVSAMLSPGVARVVRRHLFGPEPEAPPAGHVRRRRARPARGRAARPEARARERLRR